MLSALDESTRAYFAMEYPEFVADTQGHGAHRVCEEKDGTLHWEPNAMVVACLKCGALSVEKVKVSVLRKYVDARHYLALLRDLGTPLPQYRGDSLVHEWVAQWNREKASPPSLKKQRASHDVENE